MKSLFAWKHMIRIEKTDTIIDVASKIQNCQDETLFLEFPRGHSVLENYMLLKILKTTAGNRSITIVTHDILAKKLGAPLWIKYALFWDVQFFTEKKQENKSLLHHNYTFFEYFRFVIKRYAMRLTSFLWKKTGIKKEASIFTNSWFLFVVVAFFLSIGMLVFIFYFAISQTNITITPSLEVKTRALNIFYEAAPEEDSVLSKKRTISIYPKEASLSLSYVYKTTGVSLDQTARASGKIRITNELSEQIVFRPTTRLLSEDGLLFELPDWTRIPEATRENGVMIPGTLEVTALARINDVNGTYIGSRGNIPQNTYFTFPGLTSNQDRIYAVSIEDFTGWDDTIIPMISEEDMKNAHTILESMLKKEVLQKLKNQIQANNETYKTKNDILPLSDMLDYTDIQIEVADDVHVWDTKEHFTIFGSITLKTYVYNKANVINILSNDIKERIKSDTHKLLQIDEDSLAMSLILEKKEDPLTFKITTEINYMTSYDFSQILQEYTQKVKNSVAGIPTEEAKNILLNESRINSVKIENSPFFLKNIAKNPENISIKIE